MKRWSFGVIFGAHQKYFNQNASWLPLVSSVDAPAMLSFQLQSDDFHKALKKVSNWKSPGLDLIHGFWLKHFLSLNSSFLHYFNELLTFPSKLDPTLVIGRTVLSIKNPVKGNIPSNYRPITCLSVVWKLFTAILRLMLQRHLDSNRLIPFQQKGCSRGSRVLRIIYLLIKLEYNIFTIISPLEKYSFII